MLLNLAGSSPPTCQITDFSMHSIFVIHKSYVVENIFIILYFICEIIHNILDLNFQFYIDFTTLSIIIYSLNNFFVLKFKVGFLIFCYFLIYLP